MRSNLLFSALAALVVPAVHPIPALAQAAAIDSPAMVGKTVLDPRGGVVGQVTGARDGLLFVKTDRHETSLPTSSFTFQQGKLYIAFTQAQLNAEVEKTLATIAQSLAPGAAVKGSGGTVIGAIESIDAEFATIKLPSGQSIRIPRSGIAGTPGGAVIGMTAAQLEAAVAGSAQ